MGTNRIIDPGIVRGQQWKEAPDVLTAAQLVPLLHISQSSIYGPVSYTHLKQQGVAADCLNYPPE